MKININNNILFSITPSEWVNILCHEDSQYYSYLCSKMYASDIIKNKAKLNQQFGDEFKNKILKPGGYINSEKLLIDYLGRQLDINSFFELFNLNNNIEYSFFNLDNLYTDTDANSNAFDEVIYLNK